LVWIPNLETRFAQLLPNLLNQIAVAPSIAEENTAKSLWHEGPITSVHLRHGAQKLWGRRASPTYSDKDFAMVSRHRLCFEGSAKVVEAMIFPNRYRQVTEKERDHDPKAG
jgi:hypothetical protein